MPLGQCLNFLRAARLPSEQCVAGARPRWTATRQLHRCVDRRATWHLVRSRARRRTLATLHPALPALPRWQCRPSLRWLTGSACHAPPAPRCRGRTAACASGADGRTSVAEVRRLHLCTLARCMVRTAAPAGHQRHGHPATQCQLGLHYTITHTYNAGQCTHIYLESSNTPTALRRPRHGSGPSTPGPGSAWASPRERPPRSLAPALVPKEY